MYLRLGICAAFLLLSAFAWGLWQRGKVLKMEAAQATARAHAAEQVITAHKALQKELQKLRADYEERERALRAIPDDGCLDRDIPPDLGLLLAPRPAPGNSGAGTTDGTSDGR